jgi:hypothetical protein
MVYMINTLLEMTPSTLYPYSDDVRKLFKEYSPFIHFLLHFNVSDPENQFSPHPIMMMMLFELELQLRSENMKRKK